MMVVVSPVVITSLYNAGSSGVRDDVDGDDNGSGVDNDDYCRGRGETGGGDCRDNSDGSPGSGDSDGGSGGGGGGSDGSDGGGSSVSTYRQ